jgi:two-component system cell cycle response regulator
MYYSRRRCHKTRSADELSTTRQGDENPANRRAGMEFRFSVPPADYGRIVPNSLPSRPVREARTASGRLLASVALGWLGIFAIATLVTQGRGFTGRAVVDVIYVLPHVLAFAMALWAMRQASGPHRRLWAAMACAIPLWIGGEAVVSTYHLLGKEPPFPSVADAFFLSFYLVLIATFLTALRPALVIRSWKAVLDASVLASSVGYVGWFALIEPQVTSDRSLATVVGIAYPLLDVAMLTILVSLTLASFHRPPLSLLLLTGAIVTGAMTDCALTYVSLHSETPELSWLKIGWETEALLLCAAALAAVRASNATPGPATSDLRDQGLTVVLGGVAATLIAVCVEVISHQEFEIGSVVAAFYVVAAIALRLFMTSREREQIAIALERSLHEQQRIANTDELTGLRNRRFADLRLQERTGDESANASEIGVLVLDLDHFKEINDSHGHPVGDDVLRLCADRLVAVSRSGDVVARYGGEEFLVVLHDAPRDGLKAIAERFRASIAEEPFDIGDDQPIIVTTSVGGASMPADAATLTDLLRIADRALYTAKSMGRNRVQIAARGDEDGIDALVERGSVLNFVQSLVDFVDSGYGSTDHSREVARCAGLLADELGLSSAARWRACAAARLHDIGKLCVPPEILAIAGPLDLAQWELVRRHPDAGADILALAPGLEDIAEVVRQHHERHDGTGYPRGLAGEDIFTEARIVSVCDAWAAMRADRPYRRSRPEDDAAAELQGAAGQQFDPEIVAAFLRVVDAVATDEGEASRRGSHASPATISRA